MHQLEETHPDVFAEFLDGKHTISQSTQESRNFSRVWSDMTIEQSISRDCGTLGGLTGLKINVSAMERWFLTAHLKANVATATKAMLGIEADHPAIPHKESTVSRIEKDEICIENIIDGVEKRIFNPFIVESEWDSENRKQLVNIATGLVAPHGVCSWLNSCKQSGSIKLKNFLNKRIQTQTEDLFDPITKTKIKSFSSCYQKAAITKAGKLVATDIDSQIMGRLVVVSQTREVDLFGYELSSVPLSIFNPILPGGGGKICPPPVFPPPS